MKSGKFMARGLVTERIFSLVYSPSTVKAKKTKMSNVKLQHKWGHNKERGCVNFLVTKVASTKVPTKSNEVT
jgi:hypothetical protein